MSSFIMSMLEEGVEVEVPSDLTAIISILDREVPYFSCNGYGYSVTSGKGTLGKRWELMVKSTNYANQDVPPFSVGRIELEKVNDNFVSFRIPPRFDEESPTVNENDPDGRLFGSFVSQSLNTLQRHRLIELPGVLPVA